VRVVLVLQVFNGETAYLDSQRYSSSFSTYVNICSEKFESLGLAPIKRTDLLEVLCNRFAPERFTGILAYGRTVLNMSRNEIEGLVQDVAFRCLEIGCKGRMLKKLLEHYSFLDDAIRARVMKIYRLKRGRLAESGR